MVEYNLQFFGGRGAGGGESLGGGSEKPINIKSQTDVWSYRHQEGNEPFVDAINSGVRTIVDNFGDVMDVVESVYSAELGGSDKAQTLGFYSVELDGTTSLSLNSNFTDIEKMNRVYDKSVSSGYHPSRGEKSGVEAVTLHEMGHALTESVGRINKLGDLDATAKVVVENAYKSAKGRGGTKAWAGKISGYAQESNAECIAEAVADVYCNGVKAHANSKAIVRELRRMSGIER